MKKKFVYSLLLLSSLFTTGAVNADTYRIIDEKSIVLDNEALTKRSEVRQPSIEARAYGTYVEKKNVRTYYEWSGYRPVSHTLRTSSAGGSISTDKTTTFGVSISGDISRVNLSVSGSVSSTVGYTLNVPANRSAYLGFRVLYKVESGTRVEYFHDGGIYKRSNYVVKVPVRGEYALVYR